MSATKETQVHSLIANRWSPRAFTGELLEEGKLTSMFEAARLAPSNMNLQPWRFIYAHQQDTDAFNNILDVLWELNQTWAKNASVLVVALTEAVNPKTGERNPHAWHDVGLAVENLVLQGEALGVKAHQMAGFDAEKARENFGIPENFEVVSVTALGYPGDPDQLPDKLRERELKPSERVSLDSIVFRNNL